MQYQIFLSCCKPPGASCWPPGVHWPQFGNLCVKTWNNSAHLIYTLSLQQEGRYTMFKRIPLEWRGNSSMPTSQNLNLVKGAQKMIYYVQWQYKVQRPLILWFTLPFYDLLLNWSATAYHLKSIYTILFIRSIIMHGEAIRKRRLP